MDISPAVNLLIDYNAPRFTARGFSDIRMWINEGCDMDRDIIPVMKQLMEKNKNIGGLGYFREAIYRARDSRRDVEAARAARAADAHNEASREAARAKNLAFLIRKLGRCMPTDERWLIEYESINGIVVL